MKRAYVKPELVLRDRLATIAAGASVQPKAV